jgi:hypothetical protein
VLLVTFLNTLFVVPVPVLLTNDIYRGLFVYLSYCIIVRIRIV